MGRIGSAGRTVLSCVSGARYLQLAESERSANELRSATAELERERDSLNDKIRRGADAISKTSKLQEKLEAKLSKLSTDKAAAEEEAASAKATATQLEVRLAHLQSCICCRD